MIYLDSAATTLQKPPQVARASAWAMGHLASPGRGGHSAAMAAADTRVVYFPAELMTRPGMLPEMWRTVLLQQFTMWISTMNMKKEYRLAILSKNGLRERITTYLTMQASRRQKTAFTISYSREELAAFLCVNRSALSHELSRMQSEGLISFRKNYFCVHYLSPSENGQILPF